MSTIQDLENDPRFKELDYNHQSALRAKFFEQKIAVDPRYATLDPEAQKQLYVKAVYRAPVLSNPGNTFAREAQAAVEAMDAGNFDKAAQLAGMREGAKTSLLAVAAMRGADAVGNIFRPDKSDDFFSTYYGVNGDSVDQWLASQAALRGGEEAVKKISNAKLGWSLGIGAADFIATLMIGGAVASGAKAVIGAAKGLTALEVAENATKAAQLYKGVLTGTRAEEAAQTAMRLANPSSPLMKALAAKVNRSAFWTGFVRTTAGGIESGIAGTGLDLLRETLAGEHPDIFSKEGFDKLASNFGMNVALNYVGWGLAKAAGVGLKALGKSMSGLKAQATDASEEAIKASQRVAEDNVAIRGMTREQAETYKFLDVNADQAMNAPKTRAGMSAWAQALDVGHDIDWDSKTITNLATGDKVTFVNDVDAAIKLGEIVQTGMASKVEPGAKAAAIATSKTGEFVRKVTYKLNGQVDPDKLRGLLDETGDPLQDRANRNFFAKQYALANGVDPKAVEKLDTVFSSKVGIIGDNQIGMKPGAEGLDSFVNSMDEWIAKELGPTADNSPVIKKPFQLEQKGYEPRPGSFTAIKATAKELGLTVERAADKFVLKDANGVASGAMSLRQTYATVLGKAIDGGKMTVEQLNAILTQRTGYSLERGMRKLVNKDSAAERLMKRKGGEQVEVEYFSLYKTGGGGKKIIDTAPSLQQLLEAHPELDLRLPSTFAPKMWIVDDGKLTVADRIATGPADQLLELGAQYTSVQNRKSLFKDSSGKVIANETTYEVLDNVTGHVASFSGPKAKAEAIKYLKKQKTTYEKTRDALSLREHGLMFAPDGSPIIVGPTGQTRVFRSMGEVEKWIGQQEIPPHIEESLPIDPNVSKVVTEQVGRAAELAKAAADKKPVLKPSKVFDAYAQVAFPTENFLAKRAKESGDGKVLEMYKRLKDAWRMVSSADSKSEVVIHAIFKGVKYEKKLLYNVLIQNDEAKWADLAQKAFNTKLDEADIEKMRQIRTFYDESFKASGIYDWKKVMNYSARIRDYARANLDEVPDTVSAEEYIQKVFGPGGIPHDFVFFSERQRASNLVRMALYDDAERVMLSYSSALNRAKYMRVAQREVDVQVKNLKKAYAESAITRDKVVELEHLERAIDEMHGINEANSSVGRMIKAKSKNLSQTLMRICQAVPVLRNTNLANEGLVGDIVDAMHRQITLATQAKPWTIVRNMMQVQLLGAALNNNKIVMEALMQVVNEPAEKTISRILKSGAVKGTLYQGGTQARAGLWQGLMKWNENMDIITRATSFAAAEKLLDSGWTRYTKGIINATQLVKETSLSIIDEGARKKVLDALDRGDRELATDVFGEALNRLVFFDYSKINRAPVQQGFLGKVFGKFATYPLGAIAFYQRIATSGSVGERFGRIVRMGATSAAIYEAFRACGIQYAGFTAMDPFTFQGGPLWSVLAEGTALIGDDPTAKMNRAHVKRTLSLMSPTLCWLKQVNKSMSLLEAGDTYSAALALMGAPVRKDLAWQERLE